MRQSKFNFLRLEVYDLRSTCASTLLVVAQLGAYKIHIDFIIMKGGLFKASLSVIFLSSIAILSSIHFFVGPNDVLLSHRDIFIISYERLDKVLNDLSLISLSKKGSEDKKKLAIIM